MQRSKRVYYYAKSSDIVHVVDIWDTNAISTALTELQSKESRKRKRPTGIVVPDEKKE
jgi:hypothetical protein